MKKTKFPEKQIAFALRMAPDSSLFAALDVGSHSVKLRLARRDPDGSWRTAVDAVEVTGLGLAGAAPLDPVGRRRTLDALRRFAGIVAQRAPAGVAAVGTMVLRRAPDAAEFLAAVRRETGFVLEVISGEDEARLTYLGAVRSLPIPLAAGGLVLVCDIGGASTEFAWGRTDRPDGHCSLPFGTITETARQALDRAMGATAVDAAIAAVERRLRELPPLPPPELLVGVGATPASLLALDCGRDIADAAEVHGRLLEPAVVGAQIDRLRRLDATARRHLPGLHPDRGRVVLAGAVILAAGGRRWPAVPLRVSADGLRLGLLVDRFGDAAA